MAMNFEQARQNMVENQVRPWEVLDARVLEVLGRVRREDFVAAEHRQLAFADVCLPLGHGEVMMKPVLEGRLLQALALTPGDRVLEVGTGSGFFTACLAGLGGEIVSVEIHADFTDSAAQRLTAAGVANVTLETGDAVLSWAPKGQFDVVVLTGAVAQLPERMLGWLKPNGRILVIRGESPAQQVVLLTQEGAGRYREEVLLETDLPYLVNAEPVRRFVF
jgi:protein-L-isoaspartate(D-aspartate) O-methyltransferase